MYISRCFRSLGFTSPKEIYTTWLLGIVHNILLTYFLLPSLLKYSTFVGNSGASGVVSAWFVSASFSGFNLLADNHGNALQVKTDLYRVHYLNYIS